MKFMSEANKKLDKFNKIVSPIITVMYTLLSVCFLWKANPDSPLENTLLMITFISEGLLLLHYKLKNNHSSKR